MREECGLLPIQQLDILLRQFEGGPLRGETKELIFARSWLKHEPEVDVDNVSLPWQHYIAVMSVFDLH
jgi:hypothetical protein